MSYSATKIANYFIEQSDYKVSPMKLIKLVYIAHGWHLALSNNPLIDEIVKAWKYGITIDSLYYLFKRYGNLEITKLATDPSYDVQIDNSTTKLLNKVWDVYGGFTATQLANLTHKSGSPWDKAWNCHDSEETLNSNIDNLSIGEYYKKLR